MERLLVSLLLLIFVTIGHASQAPQCCPGGQPVLYKRQGVYSCWDSETNAVWPISLKCNNIGHLPQGNGLNLVVDQNGDLNVQMKNREISHVRNR